MPKLQQINGQWHVIHNGISLQNHAEHRRGQDALKVFQAKHRPGKALGRSAKPAKADKAPAAVEDDPTDNGETIDMLDTSILDGSVAALIEALATGDYDGDIDALIEVENAKAKPRKSALKVLASRQA